MVLALTEGEPAAVSPPLAIRGQTASAISSTPIFHEILGLMIIMLLPHLCTLLSHPFRRINVKTTTMRRRFSTFSRVLLARIHTALDMSSVIDEKKKNKSKTADRCYKSSILRNLTRVTTTLTRTLFVECLSFSLSVSRWINQHIRDRSFRIITPRARAERNEPAVSRSATPLHIYLYTYMSEREGHEAVALLVRRGRRLKCQLE